MKILLATTVNNLAEKFAVLSPELEYCAIVIDNVEPAKEILDKLDLSNVPLYPMSELKTCTENLNYDYLLYIQDKLYGLANLRKLISYEVPTEKVISFSKLPTNSNWDVERRLRYYREHAQDFEMFTTGTSTTMWGIDIREFKYKTINFGLYSQDLYYNFQVAKSVILYGGGIVEFIMLSLDSRIIPSISIFQRRFYLKIVYCLILLLLMIFITFLYLLTFMKNFFAKNGC